MKKMEATRHGKPSQARRPLVPAEFDTIIETLGNTQGSGGRYVLVRLPELHVQHDSLGRRHGKVPVTKPEAV